MLTFFALGALLSGAPAIDFTNASSFMGARTGTWQYGPENLWDGKDDTAWCVGVAGAAIDERVAVEFDSPVRIDALRIAPGDSIKFGGFGPANRPHTLSISNGSYVWQVIMPNDATPFELPIPPPITGRQLVIKIDESFTDQAKTTCVAGITFLQGGAPIKLTPAAKQVGPGTVEGVWVLANVDVPQVYLTFLRDGRMRAHQETLDTTPPPPREHGKWRRETGTRLEMTLNGVTETVDMSVRPHPGDGRPRLFIESGRFKGEWVSFVPGLTFQTRP